MKNIIKYLIKLLIRVIILSVIFLGIIIWFLSSPSVLMDYSNEYYGIKVYSDKPISNNIESTIESVLDRVSENEIYLDTSKPDIYLINNPDYYSVITFLTFQNKFSHSFNLIYFNNIFVNIPVVEEINIKHDPHFVHTHLEGKLDQIIAHEYMHRLIADKLGYYEEFKMPKWKIEGYSEYASTIKKIKEKPGNTLVKRAKPLYNYKLFTNPKFSAVYFKSQLAVEYLAEIHGMDFEEIINNPIKYEDLSAEFDEWYYHQTTH